MAKGLRASRNKANNAKLRANVFSPAEDARKERLSAKLMELASKPKARRNDDIDMRMDEDGTPGARKTCLRSDGQANVWVADPAQQSHNVPSTSVGDGEDGEA